MVAVATKHRTDLTCTWWDLLPNWSNQISRITCPCCDPETGLMWFRDVSVVTLGELFLALGQRYSAEQIYALYQSLRIVAVKRRKGHEQNVGLSCSDFQSAKLKFEQMPHKLILVEEYAGVTGQGSLNPNDPSHVSAAIRYLYKCLLCDLRPPWLSDQFPQALPGCGLLSTYTRPSFLTWDYQVGLKCFGERVVEWICDAVQCWDLEVAGFIARPLYVCTTKVGHNLRMCLSLASMSKLMTQSGERSHYRCRKCVELKNGAPNCHESPKRVLQLYALVHTGVSKPTPVRMRPVRLVLFAPPEQWAWGEDPSQHRVSPKPGNPERIFDSRGYHWSYELEESDAIWLSAGPYLG